MADQGRYIGKCDCGGDVRGVHQFGQLFSWCTKCTPVVNIATPAPSSSTLPLCPTCERRTNKVCDRSDCYLDPRRPPVFSSKKSAQPTEEQVKVAATVIANSPMIDAPKLFPEQWMGLARTILEAVGAPVSHERRISGIGIIKILREQRDDLAEALRGTLNWLTSYPGGGALKAYDRARSILDKVPTHEQQLRNVLAGLDMTYEELTAALAAHSATTPLTQLGDDDA